MSLKGLITWLALALAITIPVGLAARSPLLEWREPVYILAGFAGVAGLALLLVQPLLIVGALPGVRSLCVHMWTGTVLIILVVIHIAGLWVASPPDVVDVLLFRSPTPFSIWGALAMWAIFTAGILAVGKKWLGLRFWRLAHSAAAITTVVGTVVHAWFVLGTMEVMSKGTLCLLVLGASVWALRRRRVWRLLSRPKRRGSRSSTNSI